MNSDDKIKVIFVCLGNICRSPLAEGIFKQQISQLEISNQFIVDSAGTASYHVGSCPDCRALSEANKLGIDLNNHCARQFCKQDFVDFDYILVMDHLNYEAILEFSDREQDHDKVFLFRTFDTQSKDFYNVPDPYYGSEDDFSEVSAIVSRSSQGFINFLRDLGKIK